MQETTTQTLPSTLWHALERARSETQHGLVFDDGRARRMCSWADLASRARSAAAALIQAGVGPGARVGVVSADPEEFVVAFLGAIACRALPVAIAPESPIVAGVRDDRLQQLLACCGARHVVAGMSAFGARERAPELAANVRVIASAELRAGLELAELAHAPDASDICLVQLTSGSTQLPRAVAVTHDNLVQNVRATHAVLGSRGQREVGVTWLPLWHDMGLIASLITPLLGLNTHVIQPAHRFAASPRSWLEAIHEHRGTITATTNFGLYLALKRPPRLPALDLSSLRTVLIGAEPINPDVLRRFEHTFAPYGLSPAALCPAYGMAEATLAISLSRPDRSPTILRIARNSFERAGRIERAAPEGDDALELVGCGSVLPRHDVRVLDADGRELAPGIVGEIAVGGPSLTTGLLVGDRIEPHGQPNAPLRTGDLGFLHDGELFVSGRAKDLIIVAGRNVAPQLIEWQLGKLGAREGSAVAFSVPGHGTERLVIVVECEDPRAADTLATRVRATIPHELGVNVDDALIVRPWTLPKTTSGKVQRSRVRELYLRGQLPRISTLAVQAQRLTS